jgi:hypothetical protein
MLTSVCDGGISTEEAISVDGDRPLTLALLAVVRAKAGDGDAAQDLLAHALSTARARPEVRHRVLALKAIATAQSDAGLRNDAASTFAEAVELARPQDELLREIADGVGLTAQAVTDPDRSETRLSGCAIRLGCSELRPQAHRRCRAGR